MSDSELEEMPVIIGSIQNQISLRYQPLIPHLIWV